MKVLRLGVIVVLFVPLAAAAVEVPVTYLVDFKQFKRNVRGGDPLSFELHTDPGCGAAAHTEVIPAQYPDLVTERILTKKVRGSSVRPPKGLRLSAVLNPLTFDENQFWLRVIGSGIVGVPGDCQPQLPHPPGGGPADVSARVFSSVGFAISNNTATVLTFDSERFDTASLHSTSSNTSRLTAPVAGKYLIYGQVQFDVQGTGHRTLFIRQNGTDVIATVRVPPVSTGEETDLSLVTHYDLVAGDYVELAVSQTSGGVLDMNAGFPTFGMVKLP